MLPVSNNVGKALSTKVLDHGLDMKKHSIKPKLHMQIDNVSGTFAPGETANCN